MYVLEYLIYHLRPYGIIGNIQELPPKLTTNDMKLLFDRNEKEKEASNKKT